MKNLIITLTALLVAGSTYAASEIVVHQPRTPSSFSIDAGGFVKTTDFADDTSGVLLGLTGYPGIGSDNLGLYGDVRLFDNKNTFIDESHAGLLIRVNEGAKSSLAIYGGAWVDWQEGLTHVDRNDLGVEAGLRGDVSLFDSPVKLGAKIGWEKQFSQKSDHAAVGAAFLSYGF